MVHDVDLGTETSKCKSDHNDNSPEYTGAAAITAVAILSFLLYNDSFATTALTAWSNHATVMSIPGLIMHIFGIISFSWVEVDFSVTYEEQLQSAIASNAENKVTYRFLLTF